MIFTDDRVFDLAQEMSLIYTRVVNSETFKDKGEQTMYWRDYKTEKPEPFGVCLVEFDTVNHKPFYRIASYLGDYPVSWKLDDGVFNDGKMTLRWIPLTDIIESIKDESNSFIQEAQDNANDFRDRLAVEYWQLSIRIEKLEKALITSVCLDDEQKELLHEQRKAMLAYKDVLFRRCCLNDVDLYKHTFNCKPAPEGKL